MSTKGINKLLIIALAAPIVVALFIGGGSMIWQGIVTIAKTIVPNWWTLLAYAYVAFIGFLLGKKSSKK